MSSKTFVVTESGLRPIFVDEDGVAITLDSQPCRARKGKLHCYAQAFEDRPFASSLRWDVGKVLMGFNPSESNRKGGLQPPQGCIGEKQ